MRRYLAAWSVLLLATSPATVTAQAQSPAPAPQAPAGAETLSYGPPPAWVVPPPPLEAAQSDQALTFDLLDGQVRIVAASVSSYNLLRLTARTPEALQAAAGAVSVAWQPATSRVVIHQARLLRLGGSVDLLADGRRLTVLRREQNLERAVLDGQLTAVLQPEGMRTGDTIEFAFSIIEADPVLKGHSQLMAPNLLGTPARRLRFLVDWSEHTGFRVFAGERLKARRTQTSLTIDLKEVQPRMFPEDAPTRYLRSSAIEATSFASWGEVSALLAPLYATAATLPPTSAVRDEARRIAAAHPDKAGRLLAALRLVQDEVRYLFLGMDLGGYRPATAEETWARRFGDCKGKTALLLALLAELDIPAQAALVHSRLGDGLDERLPMPAQFDHVIVKAVADGRTYWLDGTRAGDRGLQSLTPPPLGWALPLAAGVTAPEALVAPLPPAPLAELRFDVDASAGFDRRAKASIARVYRGAAAAELRRDLQLIPDAQRAEALKQFFDRGWSRLKTSTVTERWDDARGDLTLTAEGSFDLDLERTSTGTIYRFPARKLAMPKPFERAPLTDRDDKLLPFVLPFPYDEVEQHSLLLPDTGQKLRIAEPDIDRELAGWRLERRIRSEGRKIDVEIRERTLVRELANQTAAAARAELVRLNEAQVQITIPDRRAQPAKGTGGATDTAALWSGLKAVLEAAGPEAALKTIEALPPGTVTDPEFDVMRWMLMAQTGRGEEAVELARASVEAKPDDPVLVLGEGRLLGAMGRTEPALEAIERRLALGLDAQALAIRAEIGTSRPLAERLKDLDEANRLQPSYATAWSTRGLILARDDKPKEALAATNEALARFPDERLALELRAELLEQGDDKAGALADLDRLVELEPGNAMRWNARCWFRTMNGFPPEEALPDCNRALALAPRAAAALDSRGLVHLRMGKFKEALADYEAALAVAPELAASLWGRGVARKRLGSPAEGAADLKKARAIAPTIDRYMASSGISP